MTEGKACGEGSAKAPDVAGPTQGNDPPPSPTPLLCAVCLADGLPEALAMISAFEMVYATEDGEPACESCGMERGYFPWHTVKGRLSP